ncbi:hypothetical protein [Mesorhizobium sp. 131-2-1]|uniref:hypothetical protein n=1 Tax=Mesorhizobium sp. 131-2-1 TaxID=2744518 RepID=UPI0019295133|nr:hypothetical protein [Mesorhizobium sp. 131-2-1]
MSFDVPSAFGSSRHFALSHNSGNYRGKADIAFAPAAGFMGTQPNQLGAAVGMSHSACEELERTK